MTKQSHIICLIITLSLVNLTFSKNGPIKALPMKGVSKDPLKKPPLLPNTKTPNQKAALQKKNSIVQKRNSIVQKNPIPQKRNSISQKRNSIKRSPIQSTVKKQQVNNSKDTIDCLCGPRSKGVSLQLYFNDKKSFSYVNDLIEHHRQLYNEIVRLTSSNFPLLSSFLPSFSKGNGGINDNQKVNKVRFGNFHFYFYHKTVLRNFNQSINFGNKPVDAKDFREYGVVDGRFVSFDDFGNWYREKTGEFFEVLRPRTVSHYFGNQLEVDICLDFFIFLNKMIKRFVKINSFGKKKKVLPFADLLEMVSMGKFNTRRKICLKHKAVNTERFSEKGRLIEKKEFDRLKSSNVEIQVKRKNEIVSERVKDKPPVKKIDQGENKVVLKKLVLKKEQLETIQQQKEKIETSKEMPKKLKIKINKNPIETPKQELGQNKGNLQGQSPLKQQELSILEFTEEKNMERTQKTETITLTLLEQRIVILTKKYKKKFTNFYKKVQESNNPKFIEDINQMILDHVIFSLNSHFKIFDVKDPEIQITDNDICHIGKFDISNYSKNDLELINKKNMNFEEDVRIEEDEDRDFLEERAEFESEESVEYFDEVSLKRENLEDMIFHMIDKRNKKKCATYFFKNGIFQEIINSGADSLIQLLTNERNVYYRKIRFVFEFIRFLSRKNSENSSKSESEQNPIFKNEENLKIGLTRNLSLKIPKISIFYEYFLEFLSLEFNYRGEMIYLIESYTTKKIKKKVKNIEVEETVEMVEVQPNRELSYKLDSEQGNLFVWYPVCDDINGEEIESINKAIETFKIYYEGEGFGEFKEIKFNGEVVKEGEGKKHVVLKI